MGDSGARIVAISDHAAAALGIYRLGIDEGNAAFEMTVPDWEDLYNANLPGHRRHGAL